MELKFDVHFLMVSLVIVLASTATATPGTATFYTNYVPSACYGSTPEGTMIAAASDSLWAGGAICGKMFNVTCTGPTNPVPHPCTGQSVQVKIVDHCPGCGGTLDLSKEAFTAIANPVAGVIKIEYTQCIHDYTYTSSPNGYSLITKRPMV